MKILALVAMLAGVVVCHAAPPAYVEIPIPIGDNKLRTVQLNDFGVIVGVVYPPSSVFDLSGFIWTGGRLWWPYRDLPVGVNNRGTVFGTLELSSGVHSGGWVLDRMGTRTALEGFNPQPVQVLNDGTVIGNQDVPYLGLVASVWSSAGNLIESIPGWFVTDARDNLLLLNTTTTGLTETWTLDRNSNTWKFISKGSVSSHFTGNDIVLVGKCLCYSLRPALCSHIFIDNQVSCFETEYSYQFPRVIRSNQNGESIGYTILFDIHDNWHLDAARWIRGSLVPLVQVNGEHPFLRALNDCGEYIGNSTLYRPVPTFGTNFTECMAGPISFDGRCCQLSDADVNGTVDLKDFATIVRVPTIKESP